MSEQSEEYDLKVKELEEQKGFPICGARNREGLPCTRKAGTGTDHLGVGRCKHHGGKNQSPTAKNFKHGLYSGVQFPGIQEEFERLKQDRDIFDLRDHIFTMEAIGSVILKSARSTEDLLPAVKVIDTATKAIQRLHEIEVERRYVISVERFGNTLDKLVDIIYRHIPDPYTRTLISDEIMHLQVATAPKQLVEHKEEEHGED